MTLATGSRNHDAHRGLTLIEVLVSIVLVSVGAIGITHALVRASYAMNVVEQSSAVQLFTVSKMANLELAVESGDTLADHEDGSFRLGQQQFEWHVDSPPPPEGESMQAVSLNVTWQDGRHEHDRRVQAFIRLPEASAP